MGILIKVVDATGVKAAARRYAIVPLALLEKKFGQIAAILASDTGN